VIEVCEEVGEAAEVVARAADDFAVEAGAAAADFLPQNLQNRAPGLSGLPHVEHEFATTTCFPQ